MGIKVGQKIRLIDLFRCNPVLTISSNGIIEYDEDMLDADKELYEVKEIEVKKYKDASEIEHEALTMPGIGEEEYYDPDEKITIYHLCQVKESNEHDYYDPYLDVIEAESWM